MKIFAKTLLFVFWITIFSCQKDEQTEPISLPDNNPSEFYNELKDESYGSDPLQKFDLFLPKKRSTKVTRVLVLLHGGGWKEGDKGVLSSIVDILKAKKYNWAIVNANYRLTSQKNIGLQQQMDDIALLLNKLKIKQVDYGISDRILLAGFSAGGHLALSFAYKFDVNRQVKAVCGIVAPTDLGDAFFQKTGLGNDIAKLLGKNLDESPETYRNGSPAFQVQQNSPPTILFYGGKDDVVPSIQGDILQKKLQSLGVPFEYNFYPEQNHDFTVLPEATEKMMKFGEKYVPILVF